MKIQNIATKTFLALAVTMAFAQSQEVDTSAARLTKVEEEVGNVKGQVEGLNESYLETKGTVDKLAKIKISGYAQLQAVYALDTGIQNAKDNGLQQGKFEVRRGRLKVNYDNGKLGNYVMQFQFNEGGARTIDMYANMMDPWINMIGLQAGIQDLPFGYEIGHSSSSMETMERSLFERSILKDEKDLGFLLTVAPPKGIASNFNFKVGAFNHNVNGVENDDNKPIIGRLGVKTAFYDAGLAIDGGLSFLVGKTQSRHDTLFTMDATDTLSVISKGNKNKDLDKSIYGADIQVYYDVPVLGGAILRGEVGMGQWVTNKSDNLLYTGLELKDSKLVPVIPYIRNVMGYYVSYVQNIGNMFQTVVRYESFDPNTDLDGAQIAKNKLSSKSDMQMSQIGGGAHYFVTENVRLSLYYDHPINEEVAALKTTAANTNFSKDVSDDVVTFRFQIKF